MANVEADMERLHKRKADQQMQHQAYVEKLKGKVESIDQELSIWKKALTLVTSIEHHGTKKNRISTGWSTWAT